jgi:hypothetical protein
MQQIEPAFRERLSKILGLLGSSYDGEVVAAARRADALIRGASLTWRDLIVPAPVAVVTEEDDDDDTPDQRMANACVRADCDTAIFGVRESQFIRSIASQIRRGRKLSEKQRDWLSALYERATARAA